MAFIGQTRSKVHFGYIKSMLGTLESEIRRRLDEKGYGSWISRHEILGFLKEEFDEYCDGVHENAPDTDLVGELLDVAVAAIMGATCIQQGLVAGKPQDDS